MIVAGESGPGARRDAKRMGARYSSPMPTRRRALWPQGGGGGLSELFDDFASQPEESGARGLARNPGLWETDGKEDPK